MFKTRGLDKYIWQSLVVLILRSHVQPITLQRNPKGIHHLCASQGCSLWKRAFKH